MVLKEKKVLIDNREITIKEMSFIAGLELGEKEKVGMTDLYKNMLSKEDYEFLNSVGKVEGAKMREAFNQFLDEVNADTKKKDENGK
jgi:hypothetical protein